MSDIMGYRQDGGLPSASAGMEASGLQPQLSRILRSKAPLLNSPGTVIENALYYDAGSSSVTAVEMQETYGKDQIELTSKGMGTSPSAYIPSVLFANTLFLHLKMATENVIWPATVEVTAHGTAVTDYFHIPDAWGFHAVKNIIVYMGASSIAQIELSGYGNYLYMMAAAETREKKQQILRSAGQYLNSCDPGSILAPPKNNALLFRLKNAQNLPKAQFVGASVTQTAEIAYPSLAEAIVPIRLPFSSICALEKKLSLDTRLSTQPIQITFQLRGSAELFNTTSTTGFSSSLNTYDKAIVEIWQQELSDKSLSVRNELLAMPDYNVGYPFQYSQTIPFPFGTNDSGRTDYPFTVNITSIINSDLTTFLFAVRWSGDLAAKPYTHDAPAVAVDAASYCKLFGMPLEDLELKLNGQRFFVFNGNVYDGAFQAKSLGPSFPLLQRPVINNVQGFYPQVVGAGAGYQDVWPQGAYTAPSSIYELNNTRLRAIMQEAHMLNTARFTNQTFQLTFHINRDLFFTKDVSASIENLKGYTLEMQYLYNAVFLIGGDGGTTKLITN